MRTAGKIFLSLLIVGIALAPTWGGYLFIRWATPIGFWQRSATGCIGGVIWLFAQFVFGVFGSGFLNNIWRLGRW